MIRCKNFFRFVPSLNCFYLARNITFASMLRRNLTGLLLVAAIHLSPHTAQAALLLDFTGGGANTFGGAATVGWEFTLNSSMLVDGLGFWDNGSDGLVNSHDVGIWNTSNPTLLLTSTTVTNGSSTAVASTSSTGRWLFNNIPSITLSPGTYVVGGTIIASDADSQQFNASASMLSGVTFVQARNVGSPSLLYPTPSPVFNDGIFGPNIRGTLVPEPNTALMVLAATATFYTLGRKRQNGRLVGSVS